MSGDAPVGERRDDSPDGRRLGADRRWATKPIPPGDERRSGLDRRRVGRRVEDARGGHGVVTIAWTLIGAFVVLYLLLLAVGAYSVDSAPALGIVALVLGVAWLVHGWRRFFSGAPSPVEDRQRRGH